MHWKTCQSKAFNTFKNFYLKDLLGQITTICTGYSSGSATGSSLHLGNVDTITSILFIFCISNDICSPRGPNNINNNNYNKL